MRAYFMDDSLEDQRLPHDSGKSLSLSELAKLGVLYWSVDMDAWEKKIDEICEERNYKNRDEVTVSPKMAEYETKIKAFFTEHVHEDEEIRFILDGSGFFDVRDQKDRWIRCAMEKGDLMILPAGIYHRFTTDSKDYIKAMRLFQNDPKWTPINRPCDDNEYRKAYVSEYHKGSSCSVL